MVCILKHLERRNQWRSKGGKGRDAWWELAGAGGQNGSVDSPGKGEPQDVGIMYLILLL